MKAKLGNYLLLLPATLAHSQLLRFSSVIWQHKMFLSYAAGFRAKIILHLEYLINCRCNRRTSPCFLAAGKALGCIERKVGEQH